MIFPAFAAFLLLAPITHLWPVVRQNRKGGAQNNPLLISIYPDDGSLQWRAVLAGERVQFYTRWLGALVPAAVGWALGLPDLGAVFLAFACCLWTVPFYRLNEYPGKAAFSIVTGKPVDSEAQFLIDHYPEFRGMGVEAVARNLRRSALMARLLVKGLRL